MSDYATFKNKYTGQRLNVDGVFQYQCVDLIIQYAREVLGTNASMYGNAIDMWTHTPQGLLDTCDRLATTDCQVGDIVVLRTAGHNDFTGDGHIGIADHQDAGNVWLLEQNALGGANGTGVDAIGIHRAISKSRIAGVLRPRPRTVELLYTIEPIVWKEIKVKPGSRKWNLGHPTFNDVAANPITTADDNTTLTVKAVLHHRAIPQYNYYLDDPNAPYGWNVLDCPDYTPPPPPVTPPAAPIKGKPVETYTLQNTVMYFKNALDARDHRNPISTLDPLKDNKPYIVYERAGNSYHLSRDNMKDDKYWINISDDVPPEPKPEPLPPKITETIQNASELIPPPPQDFSWMKMTYLRADKKPVNYVCTSIQSIPVYDFITKQKLGDLNQHKVLAGKNAIVGTFQKQAKDGRVEVFARRVVDVQYDLWPTIPADYLIPEIDDDDADFAYMEKMTGWFDINSQYLRKALKNTKTFIDGIIGRER